MRSPDHHWPEVLCSSASYNGAMCGTCRDTMQWCWQHSFTDCAVACLHTMVSASLRCVDLLHQCGLRSAHIVVLSDRLHVLHRRTRNMKIDRDGVLVVSRHRQLPAHLWSRHLHLRGLLGGRSLFWQADSSQQLALGQIRVLALRPGYVARNCPSTLCLQFSTCGPGADLQACCPPNRGCQGSSVSAISV